MSKTLQPIIEKKKQVKVNSQDRDWNACGIIPPRIGSGTFGEIFALMSKEPFNETESLLEPILENRAMRRNMAEKQTS